MADNLVSGDSLWGSGAAPPSPSKPIKVTPPAPSPSAPAMPISGRLGGVLPQQQAAMQKSAVADQPAYTALQNVLAIPNATGAMLGARLRDPRKESKVDPVDTFLQQFRQSPAAAVNEYFVTSPSTMKALAGRPGAIGDTASYFVKHPTQNAALDFVGRILDAGNAGAAAAVKTATSEGGAAIRVGSRALADKIVKGNPDAETSNLVQHLRAAENLFTLKAAARWGPLRSAAEDIARKAGKDEKAVEKAGNDAVLAAVNVVNSGAYSRGIGQQMANSVLKGLTKAQQWTALRMIEGKEAVTDAFAPIVAKYRNVRAALDSASKQYRVAGTERFIDDPNYVSRAGWYTKPEKFEQGEENVPTTAQFERDYGPQPGKAVTGVRKGSLGQNIHRQYTSHDEALANGAVLKPGMTFMKGLEMHATMRTQAARINQQLDKLEELGLIVPKTRTMAGRLGTIEHVPPPQGFYDFKDLPPKLGGAEVRQFGSDITRDAWVHPIVPQMIKDVAQRTPVSGMPGGLEFISGIGRAANHLLSMFEVADPLYHPIFNVSENMASEAPNVLGMLRGAVGGGAARKEAEEIGAHLPYASGQSAHLWGRPWSDLSAAEKRQRVWLSLSHGPETVTRKALYKGIEPTMATSAFGGLRGRLGESGAALAVRSMLGEPENIPAGARGWAQAMQFPAWTLSQLKRWPRTMAQRPYLYNAPYNAIQDINESKGRGPQNADASKVFPPIVLGKTPQGDFRVLNIPHPANRAIDLMNSALQPDVKQRAIGLAYGIGGAMTPLAQGPMRWLLGLTNDQKNMLNYAAPAKSLPEQAWDTIKGFGSFSPVRGLVGQPDLAPQTKAPPDKRPFFLRDVPKMAAPPMTSVELSPERQKAHDAQMNAYLKGYYNPIMRKRMPGIIDIRSAQHKAEKAHQMQAAAKLRMSADAMYQFMVQQLTKEGYPSP